jgi:hypothetical protein
MRLLIACAALAVATQAQAGEDAVTSWSRDIGNWELSELRGQVTGAFSFCSIKTIYAAKNQRQRNTMRSDMIVLQMMYGGAQNIGVGFTADGWRTTEDKPYDLRMQFNDGRYYTVTATGLKGGGVLAIAEPNAEWLKRMMLKSSVDVYINGKHLGDFRLDGSANAIKELMKCAIAGRQEAGSDGDTFGGPSAPVSKDTF